MLNAPKLGGWRPEPKDSRDIPVSQLLSVANPTSVAATRVDLRSGCPDVEDQGTLSSCVANSVVGALEILEKERGDEFVFLSRLFIYYNARAATGTTDKDEGTFVRDAMASLASLGVCPESEWPYDTSKVFDRPSLRCYKDSYAHRIDKFYKIFSTGNDRNTEIENALKMRCPVVFGANVYKQIMDSTGRIEMPAGDTLGGHAMVIVGFDSSTRDFIIRNSWGPSWGDKGYALVNYDYLDAAGADDFWVPVL